MKQVKMLGLAAISAAAMMAVFGASSASATTLCETPAPGATCGAAWHVIAGTELDFSVEPGTSALLKGPFGETIATCTQSTVKGKTSNTGSSSTTVSGAISTLTFGTCNRPVTVSAPGSLEVHHIAGGVNGTVTSTGATVIIHNVPLFGECKYETNATDVGMLTGTTETGGAPTFDIGASIKSKNGCPTGTWSGSYVYTGATNFNVAAG